MNEKRKSYIEIISEIEEFIKRNIKVESLKYEDEKSSYTLIFNHCFIIKIFKNIGLIIGGLQKSSFWRETSYNNVKSLNDFKIALLNDYKKMKKA